jgi:hypothetical protein
MNFKGFGGMGQKLVAPLIILGLADLMLRAQFRHRLALQAFYHHHRFGLGIPFPSLHG